MADTELQDVSIYVNVQDVQKKNSFNRKKQYITSTGKSSEESDEVDGLKVYENWQNGKILNDIATVPVVKETKKQNNKEAIDEDTRLCENAETETHEEEGHEPVYENVGSYNRSRDERLKDLKEKGENGVISLELQEEIEGGPHYDNVDSAGKARIKNDPSIQRTKNLSDRDSGYHSGQVSLVPEDDDVKERTDTSDQKRNSTNKDFKKSEGVYNNVEFISKPSNADSKSKNSNAYATFLEVEKADTKIEQQVCDKPKHSSQLDIYESLEIAASVNENMPHTITDISGKETDPKIPTRIKVAPEGGDFPLDSLDVDVMIPENVTSKPDLMITITKVPETMNTESFKPGMNLISNIYEFHPHGEVFNKHLTIKFPLLSYPNRKRPVRMLYSNANSHEPIKWIYYPSDHIRDDDKAVDTLPKISWMVIDKYCVMMIDRFCFTGLGEDENDDDDKNAKKKGNQGVSNNAFQMDEDNTQANTTSSRSQHNTDTSKGLQISPSTKVSQKFVFAKLWLSPTVDDKGKLLLALRCEFAEYDGSVAEFNESIDKVYDDTDKETTKFAEVVRKNIQFKNLQDVQVKPCLKNSNYSITEEKTTMTEDTQLHSFEATIRENHIQITKESLDFSIKFSQIPAEMSATLVCCFRPREIFDTINYSISEEKLTQLKKNLYERKRNSYITNERKRKDSADKPYDDIEHETEEEHAMYVNSAVHASGTDADKAEQVPKVHASAHPFQACSPPLVWTKTKQTNDCELSSIFQSLLKTDLVKEMEKLDESKLREICSDMQFELSHEVSAQLFIHGIIMVRKNLKSFEQLCNVFEQRQLTELHLLLKCEIMREKLMQQLQYHASMLKPDRMRDCMYSQGLLTDAERATFNSFRNDTKKKSWYLLKEIVIKMDRKQLDIFVKQLQNEGHMDLVERIAVQ